MATTAVAAACFALLGTSCARPPLAANPSPSVNTTPAAQVTPVVTPSSPPTSEPTIGPPTPSHAAILQVTSAIFHAAEIGVAYAPVTLLATGGVGSYSWSISVGALPAGLSISSGGVVSGTPTSPGTASFTVHVADQASGSAIVNRSISVARRLSATALCATQCNVEIGCTTVCGRFGTLTGGVGPFTYAASGGTSLPPGMGLNGLSLTGPFPPEPAGTVPIPYRFSVAVTDSFGLTASVSATFGTYSNLIFTVSSARCAGTLQCVTSTLQYTGGTPGMIPGWKATAVDGNAQPIPLPGGFKVTFKGPSVIVTVPLQKTSYAGTVTLILTDPNLCGPSTHCPSTGNATLAVSV